MSALQSHFDAAGELLKKKDELKDEFADWRKRTGGEVLNRLPFTVRDPAR
jgi:hypothetical protein